MSRARWLALGDSYTIGEGVTPTERWPEQAARLLRERGFPLDEPTIVARTGWTARELLRGMEAAGAWPSRATSDLVTLMVGVNDQYRGRTVAEFAPDFAECLERAITSAAGGPSRVVVLSIPDWGVTPFAEGRERARIAREIDAYNAHVLEAAQARGVRTCDVTAISRSGDPVAASLAADALHPGPGAHSAWARHATPVLAAALAGPRAQS